MFSFVVINGAGHNFWYHNFKILEYKYYLYKSYIQLIQEKSTTETWQQVTRRQLFMFKCKILNLMEWNVLIIYLWNVQMFKVAYNMESKVLNYITWVNAAIHSSHDLFSFILFYTLYTLNMSLGAFL